MAKRQLMNSIYMTYSSKEECYTDVYLSLTIGVLTEKDSEDLLHYYRDIEHYECCQGILEALKDFRDIKKEYRK